MCTFYFFRKKPAAATKLLLVYSFVCLLSQTSKSQNFYLADSQLEFSLSGLIYDKLELSYVDEKILKSNRCPSGEATISYYKNIYCGLGINVGTGFTIAPYNFNYHYKSPNNQPYIGKISEDFLNHYAYVQDIYTFLVSMDYKWQLKNSHKIYFIGEIGMKLNRKAAYPYQISTQVWYDLNDSTEIVLFDFTLSNTEKRNYLSYFSKVGVLKNTKRLNSLGLNLIFHFSPTKLGKGSYCFNYLPVVSQGTVKENTNFFGVEFTYGLTFSKKLKIK